MRDIRHPRDLVGDLSGQVLGIRPVVVSPPPPGWRHRHDDPGPGTFAHPFHLIANGIKASNGKRPVYLRGGHYIENVEVTGVPGSPDRKCLITSYRGEHGHHRLLRPRLPHTEEPLDRGDGPDEFIWERALRRRGGVARRVSRHPPAHPADHLRPARGPAVAQRVRHPRRRPAAPRRDRPRRAPARRQPRMGRGPRPDGRPKRDPDREPARVPELDVHWARDLVRRRHRKVHIRLSHTRHNVAGWPDYTGLTDPRTVGSRSPRRLTPALRLTNCKHLQLQGPHAPVRRPGDTC